jgi:hypothetical protein
LKKIAELHLQAESKTSKQEQLLNTVKVLKPTQILGDLGKSEKENHLRVNYKTDELITLAAKAIKDLPEIKSPSIRSTKIGIKMTDEGIGHTYVGEKVESYGGTLGKFLMFWVTFKVKQN